MVDQLCFINGKYIPESQATVSVRDIGVMRGFGVYDGIAAVGNRIFRWEDHIKRFRASGLGLGIHLPYSDDEVKEIVTKLLAHHNFARTNIRLYLTGGQAINAIEFNPTEPTFFVLVEEWKPLASEIYTNGAALITTEFQRQFPEWKTINYIAAVKDQVRRAADGAIEILFVSGGQVREAATSNVAMVTNGTIVTPANGILKGVTRQVVIELAQKLGIPLESRDVTMTEFCNADEVFLTSSYKDIVPIVRIDEKTIGQGAPGLVTQKLMEAFKTYLQEA